MAERFKFFVCSFTGCSAMFSRSDRLETHIRTHTGERPYICEFEGCGRSYVRSQHLKRHAATHNIANIKCEQQGCFKSFRSPDELRNHTNKVHGTKPQKLYQCSYCDKQFNKRSRKMVHEARHNNTRPYVCTKEGCNACFQTPSKLKRHLKSHESRKCSKCDAVLETWNLLVKHMKTVHAAPRTCSVCSATFRKNFNLKQHEKCHMDVSCRYQCPFDGCLRAYTENKNLRYHIKVYHEARPFKCSHPGCPSAFKEKTQLERHVAKHDPTITLSSKKSKKKLKKNKDNFAAFLAGYDSCESSNHVESSNAHATDKNADNGDTPDSVTLHKDKIQEIENQSDKISSCMNEASSAPTVSMEYDGNLLACGTCERPNSINVCDMSFDNPVPVQFTVA